MSAGRLDFTEQGAGPAEQGSRFYYELIYAVGGTPVDVSGYGARMQVRATPDDEAKILDLTVGSGITVGTTDGKFTIDVSAVTMASCVAGTHVYDFEIVPGAVAANAFKLVRGDFQIRAEVTR